MGSPMVFQTAPPQPASKARMICSPQLVGGAEASQKGLRHFIPAKVVAQALGSCLASVKTSHLRSEMWGTRFSGEVGDDGEAGAFAVGDGVYDLTAAVGAVSAGEVSWGWWSGRWCGR